VNRALQPLHTGLKDTSRDPGYIGPEV
jgi:hypothetical protein